MLAIIGWIEGALERAHEVMVQHFVKVQDNPATGMRECASAIRAAAEISALTKAKLCAERDGLPDVIGLATEEVIALAATPVYSTCPTEDIYERHYLAAWASILHAARTQAT
jgi:hypothetical protein